MPFDPQPILTGRLLELRPLRADDFDPLYAVAQDPLIWEQHPASDRHQEQVFRLFFREALESGGALVAIDTRDGRIIGSSRFHGYDEARSEVEIGWTFLARSHWGGRYNREMKRLMLAHAFRFVNRVVFLIGPENHRSRRAVEKIGAVYAGSRPNADGRESVVYRLTDAAFKAGSRFPVAFGALVLAQAGHSVEEYLGRIWESFPPARLLTGLVSQDRELGFIVINVALVAFGMWCLLWPVRRAWASAAHLAWAWVVLETINGVVHSAWSLRQGGYTPGVATAPVLFVLALYLARQVSSRDRS